jgi:hypothetical protein
MKYLLTLFTFLLCGVISSQVKMNHEEIIKMIKTKGGCQLSELEEKYRADKEIVLLALEYCPDDLEYASEDLKKDKEIVLTAVNNYGPALKFAHEDLKKDKEIVLAAVNNFGLALEFAHEDLKKDKEIVLTANKRDMTVRTKSISKSSGAKIIIETTGKNLTILGGEVLTGDGFEFKGDFIPGVAVESIESGKRAGVRIKVQNNSNGTLFYIAVSFKVNYF